MDIQDRIDECVITIENLIMLHTDEEERERALGCVEDLGHQWQRANAHGHALTICAAILAGEKWNPEQTSMEELQRLETKGMEAILRVMPLGIYAGLVESFMPRPGEEEDEDE